jgi:glycosyltransferase involved in cell wall biosynthesis
MALQDKRPTNMANTYDPSSEKFALFIGGDFYANREGITWFVEHVVPRINIKTYIVGRGFEKLKVELERDSKVVVVGAVDSLSEWYQNAHFVIAPIFDGSGMKTKVAEAMMYGKKIVGTPEAFSGYEDIAIQVGWLCRTADEFVVAIAEAKSEVDTAFDMTLRVIYLNNYSFPAARERLHEIMEN